MYRDEVANARVKTIINIHNGTHATLRWNP